MLFMNIHCNLNLSFKIIRHLIRHNRRYDFSRGKNIFQTIIMSGQQATMDAVKQRHNSSGHEGDISNSDQKLATKHKKEEFELFFGPKNTFSQFHPANFTVDSKMYCCMEQYMHYQKAVTFKDRERATAIMATSEPIQHKKLGRKVTHFDKAIWGRRCVDVVKKGSLEKYRQNPKMKQVLFDTFPKTLVETSPRDRLWGIGLGKNNPEAQNRATWRGKNLLGETLTKVRNILMQEDGCMPSNSQTANKSSPSENIIKHEDKPNSLSIDEAKKAMDISEKCSSSTEDKESSSSSQTNIFTPRKTEKSISKGDKTKTPPKSSTKIKLISFDGEETPSKKDSATPSKKRKQMSVLVEDTPLKTDISTPSKKRKQISKDVEDTS